MLQKDVIKASREWTVHFEIYIRDLSLFYIPSVDVTKKIEKTCRAFFASPCHLFPEVGYNDRYRLMMRLIEGKITAAP